MKKNLVLAALAALVIGVLLLVAACSSASPSTTTTTPPPPPTTTTLRPTGTCWPPRFSTVGVVSYIRLKSSLLRLDLPKPARANIKVLRDTRLSTGK